VRRSGRREAGQRGPRRELGRWCSKAILARARLRTRTGVGADALRSLECGGEAPAAASKGLRHPRLTDSREERFLARRGGFGGRSARAEALEEEKAAAAAKPQRACACGARRGFKLFGDVSSGPGGSVGNRAGVCRILGFSSGRLSLPGKRAGRVCAFPCLLLKGGPTSRPSKRTKRMAKKKKKAHACSKTRVGRLGWRRSGVVGYDRRGPARQTEQKGRPQDQAAGEL